MKRPAQRIIREQDRPRATPVTEADAPRCEICGTPLGILYSVDHGKTWRCSRHRSEAQ